MSELSGKWLKYLSRPELRASICVEPCFNWPLSQDHKSEAEWTMALIQWAIFLAASQFLLLDELLLLNRYVYLTSTTLSYLKQLPFDILISSRFISTSYHSARDLKFSKYFENSSNLKNIVFLMLYSSHF